jgi:hypothetical protein
MTCAAGKTTRTKAVKRSCVKHARGCAINQLDQLDLFKCSEVESAAFSSGHAFFGVRLRLRLFGPAYVQ